jgi:malate dehydrogenase
LQTNASIVQGLAESCAKYCPKALILIIANPVNSTVPIFAEVYKKAGVFDEKKCEGSTSRLHQLTWQALRCHHS